MSLLPLVLCQQWKCCCPINCCTYDTIIYSTTVLMKPTRCCVVLCRVVSCCVSRGRSVRFASILLYYFWIKYDAMEETRKSVSRPSNEDRKARIVVDCRVRKGTYCCRVWSKSNEWRSMDGKASNRTEPNRRKEDAMMKGIER